MRGIFLTVLGMGITASMAIVVVLIFRLLLKGMPRIFSYILWLAVFWRLLCPFAPETGWGILPPVSLAEFYREDPSGLRKNVGETWEGTAGHPASHGEKRAGGDQAGKGVEGNVQEGNKAVRPLAAQPFWPGWLPYRAELGRLFPKTERFWQGAAVAWLSGCVLLVLYGTGCYLVFWKKLKRCRDLAQTGSREEERASRGKGRKSRLGREGHLVISGAVREPFVAGFIKPVIYLPGGLEGMQREMVLAHEKVHIARRDHLIKPIAALAVCLHWFNPLVWLAYFLMEQDMEISCDQAVLKKIGYENRKDYAKALLYLSGGSGQGMKYPVAFGEKSVKVRIKNTMRFKGVKTWAAALAAVAVLSVSLQLVVNGSGGIQEQAYLGAGREVPREQEDPGTDRDASGEYVDGEASRGSEAAGEILLLPGEKIINTQTASQDPQSTTDHEYSSYLDDYAPLLRTTAETGDARNAEKILFDPPVAGARISDDFAVRTHPATQEKRFHSGIDFAAEKGTPVMAAAEGIVFEAGYDDTAGNYVILQHENGEMTYYANCGEILVQAGQEVARGEQIALVGTSGRSTGAHLHFASSSNGRYTEPVFWESVAVQ